MVSLRFITVFLPETDLGNCRVARQKLPGESCQATANLVPDILFFYVLPMRFHQFILKNLTRRKLRTLLTVAGVAIAVAATISLLGVANGFERATTESLTQREIDIVVIEETAVDQLSSDVDERVLAEVQGYSEVAELAPSLIDLVGFDAGGGTAVNCLVQGWPPGSPSYRGLQVNEGRLLSAGDQSVTMVGEVFARNMRKSVGDTIDINGEPFEIVGVFQSFIHPENAGVVVTLKEMQRLMLQEGRLTGFGVTLKVPGSEVAAERVRDKIRAIQLPGGKPSTAERDAHPRICQRLDASEGRQFHGLADVHHRPVCGHHWCLEHDVHVGDGTCEGDQHPPCDRLAEVTGDHDDPQ